MIYIVSGLPRSGTSLMMHMLKVGGIELFYSEERERRLVKAQRPTNPYFYEHNDTLMQGRIDEKPALLGKAVKIIHSGMQNIQPGFICKLIVMIRSAEARQQSARVMQAHQQTEVMAGGQYLNAMARMIATYNGHPVLYDDLIDYPAEAVDDLIKYLDRPMDRAAMIAAVDPTLRHWTGDDESNTS